MSLYPPIDRVAARFALWVVYGVLTSAWPVTVANACALVMASGVLIMKWRFRDGEPA